VAKIKGGVNTTGIQKHVQRENNNYNNTDIDHERTHLNVDLLHGQEKKNYKVLIEQRIEEGYTDTRKVRSDAIRHVDGIITSDNDFFKGMNPDQIKGYFQDSLEFLEKEYGKENMLYATVHMDESTPHMHFGFVPLTEDGRLSAKEVVGNKKALTQFQDRYHAFVREKGYNLERGQSKHVTEKKHQDIDKFKQGTKYHENVFQQTQQKAEKQEKRLDELTAALEPQELSYEGKEIKTEVKSRIFGKPEVIEEETQNVVLTPEQYKHAAEQVHAAAAIQKDYRRLKNTDFVKENERLKEKGHRAVEIGKDLAKENKALHKENHTLREENRNLKAHIHDLRLEMKVTYQKMKQTIKENTKDFRGFKKVFTELYQNVKEGNASAREKNRLEPKISEFQKEVKQEQKKDQELSL